MQYLCTDDVVGKVIEDINNKKWVVISDYYDVGGISRYFYLVSLTNDKCRQYFTTVKTLCNREFETFQGMPYRKREDNA